MSRDYSKLLISMRYWLLGQKYHTALDALEFAKVHHTGTRKDNVTPEFQHQLEIGHYVRTLDLIDREKTLTVVFLHDVVEDNASVYLDDIRERFGEEIARDVDLLSHKIPSLGIMKKLPDYYREIGTSSTASIVKGSDRMHNVQSMIGVFTLEKQKEYVTEVEDLILPMLSAARKQYHRQETAYENIKHCLRSQIDFAKALHATLPDPIAVE